MVGRCAAFQESTVGPPPLVDVARGRQIALSDDPSRTFGVELLGYAVDGSVGKDDADEGSRGRPQAHADVSSGGDRLIPPAIGGDRYVDASRALVGRHYTKATSPANTC